MPSIAQQDYIVIAQKVGNTIDVDAYALGQLAKILEKKDTSIFDVILELARNQEYSKITSCTTITKSVGYISHTGEEVIGINIPYTSTQYEGLAAVQEAGEAQYPGEGSADNFPKLGSDNGRLIETGGTGYSILNPEGYIISVTVADGKLATVAVADEIDPAGGIKVPFEEIQKLIGLPISV